MSGVAAPTEPPLSITKDQLQSLIAGLQQAGYTVVAPTVRDEAIVYAEIQAADDLPIGWRDDQRPGQYRIRQEKDSQYFGFNVGPHSWKQFLYPPRVTVASAKRVGQDWQFDTPDESCPRYALLGVRACELAAIAVQDRVFLQGPYVDPDYKRRRENVFIVAVNCTVAASTCFCSSMETGPRCQTGFDLALTETEERFLVEMGSPRGVAMCRQLEGVPASSELRDTASRLQQRAIDQIDKQLVTEGVRELLLNNADHPHWDDVAKRCLSCTNCTMVCPTCFCATVSEVSDLSEREIVRERQWDSCFNVDFSYTSGGIVRGDIRTRYRQWLTHKLATWHDQFDTSGCVGCGRCITWCPVGIDLTEEVAQIRSQPASRRSLPVVQSQEGAACDVKGVGR